MRGGILLSILVACVLYPKKGTFHNGKQKPLHFLPSCSQSVPTGGSSAPQAPQHSHYQLSAETQYPQALGPSICFYSHLVQEKLFYLFIKKLGLLFYFRGKNSDKLTIYKENYVTIKVPNLSGDSVLSLNLTFKCKMQQTCHTQDMLLKSKGQMKHNQPFQGEEISLYRY